MPIPESLSSNFVTAAEAERETLAARLVDAQEQAEHFESLAAQAREEAGRGLKSSLLSRRKLLLPPA